MAPAPLQATGGSPTVVSLVFLALLVTVALSLVVAYLLFRGYRRNRDPGRLALAAGLVLLVTVPIVAQFVLANATDVPAVGRSAVANASKLLGLVAMLYAIYGAGRRRATVRSAGVDRPGGDEE